MMSQSFKKAAFGAWLAVGALGCAMGPQAEEGPEAVETAQDGLSVRARTGIETSGTFRSAGREIGFQATQVSPGVFRSTLSVGGATFEHTLDTSTGTVAIDGHGNAVTPALASALQEMAQRLETAVEPQAGSTVSTHEAVLLGQLKWLADTRSDYTVGTFSRANPLLRAAEGPERFSVGNNGVTCLTRSSWYWVGYLPSGWGSSYYEWAQANASFPTGSGGWPDYPYGNWSCQGQCGVGCQGWWNNGLFLDCLEHDRCTYRFTDSKCDTAKLDAVDDFTAAQIGVCR